MRETIETKNAPAAVGPYSQAMLAGDQVWVSGQLGLDPASGVMVEGGAQLTAFCTLPLRRQRVQIRIRLVPPFSVRMRMRCRLGRQMRLVTLWAWETLCPKAVFLLQTSQT